MKSQQKRKSSKVTFKSHRKQKELDKEARSSANKQMKSAESSVVPFHQ